ncbi:uncharacterized protein LAESUDRAFT_813601 [Laetiporus sulphureus 93-53]|uniref:Mixed lineage kinase domain-containing protein n=1 Tax=Laetiporus sulphureus 93-53 TaxID=1314785 RepID=A0A165DMQ9_9APHY|nr:uncharacterized protein LAESUDRAFT_813601 [Laetiporus sulphureus 93-53]KZT05217.1 hypothetical protein LAESUDRAFT_813601 [Laetiporus sulphureus 93-53]
MVLRYIRSRVKGDTILYLAVSTTTATQQLASVVRFALVSVPATILLRIFQTIQSVQRNKSECYRLANRCLALLVDISEHMDDRWDSAPPSLAKALNKFEKTLQSIYDFLTNIAGAKWHVRLFRKGFIEDTLADFHVLLDDAARSFQIATLINIHYSVGDKNAPKAALRAIPSAEKEVDYVHGSLEVEQILSPAIEYQERHFTQYHQSESTLRGRPSIRGGWWAGVVDARLNGREVLAKQYSGSRKEAAKEWARDVKILQNIFHPNLPQMLGYSYQDARTPFILLADVRAKSPREHMLETLKKSSLSDCIHSILRLYLDTLDAAIYLQRQLDLTDSKIQDYVENASYRIDTDKKLIMGLPPLEVDRITSWRNYDLAGSIQQLYLKLVPSNGIAEGPFDRKNSKENAEIEEKINHAITILKAVLPDSNQPSTILARLQKLLGENEDDQTFLMSNQGPTLRQIRLAALQAGTHNHMWRESVVPPNTYAIGDLGYVSGEGTFVQSFTVLCNVIKEGLVSMDISQGADGTQQIGMGNRYTGRDTARDTDSPTIVRELCGFCVAIPSPSRQESGADIQCLDQRFSVADMVRNGFNVGPQHMMSPEQQSFGAFSQRAQPQQGFGAFGQQAHFRQGFSAPIAPQIVYLFTSMDKEEEWSDAPIPRGPAPAGRKTYHLLRAENFAFLNYVQLHPEDFVD